MKRMIHDVVQGADAWHKFRLDHHGASEAAAMLGLSKTVTRTELLTAKATGLAKEFSNFVQTRILDRGHELEALARPIVEEHLGEELFPATYSLGKLSASCDGLTIDGGTAFEHKQWERELAAAVSRGELPDEHQPQCQQVLHVTGAERLIFAVSDGTKENFVSVEVLPDEAWVARIEAGWKQFDEDVVGFEHIEVLPPAVAEVKLGLPALSIQVNGQISLIDNLGVFGARLSEFIAAIDRNPSTDQAFADTEAAIKTLEKAQVALEAAEAGALAQTASIDEMRRTVAQFVEQARTTRLALEKIVKARKDTIRIEIVQKGKADFASHIASLNKQIGRDYMPDVPTDFPGVIKNKRTIASLRDAVTSELARAKIVANEIGGHIQINMATLRELAREYAFLFADERQLALKSNDDLKTLVNARIVEHKAAEQKRLDDERERIRQEEDRKRLEMQRAAQEQIERQERESQLRIEAQERAAREQREEQDRIARIAREAQERAAAEARAAEEKRLQDERDRLAAEARALEERQRKEREAQERSEREERMKREAEERAQREAAEAEERAARQALQDVEDGNDMLHAFIERFGQHPQYASVVKAITAYFTPKQSRQSRQKAAA
jgi:predicted phage-related endonuclease